MVWWCWFWWCWFDRRRHTWGIYARMVCYRSQQNNMNQYHPNGQNPSCRHDRGCNWVHIVIVSLLVTCRKNSGWVYHVTHDCLFRRHRREHLSISLTTRVILFSLPFISGMAIAWYSSVQPPLVRLPDQIDICIRRLSQIPSCQTEAPPIYSQKATKTRWKLEPGERTARPRNQRREEEVEGPGHSMHSSGLLHTRLKTYTPSNPCASQDIIDRLWRAPWTVGTGC